MHLTIESQNTRRTQGIDSRNRQSSDPCTLSVADCPNGQKTGEETEAFSTLLPSSTSHKSGEHIQERGAEDTVFSSSHGIFSRVDHGMSQKAGFNKFKRSEIIPSRLSDHNGDDKANNKRKCENLRSIWKLKHTLLYNQWVKEHISKGIRKYFEMHGGRTQHSKAKGYS